MFFLGIFFPLLWIIGAFMQPAKGRLTDFCVGSYAELSLSTR
jgi:hypothetical protein